jgi:hypothetical protein
MTPTAEEILNGKTADASSLEKIALELELIAANFRLMAQQMSPEKKRVEEELGRYSRN